MAKKKSKENTPVEVITKPQPQIIEPFPVPSTYQVATVTDDESGQQFVMLAVSSPTGRSVFFLESEIAGMVGETLIKLADQTKGSGLILPPSGLEIPRS